MCRRNAERLSGAEHVVELSLIQNDELGKQTKSHPLFRFTRTYQFLFLKASVDIYSFWFLKSIISFWNYSAGHS